MGVRFSFDGRAATSLAQGFTGTNSKRPTQYTSLHPRFIVRGEGPYIFDANQNKYVDFVCSLGANILGHQNAVVNEAVKRQLNRGVLFSMASPLELEVAELIVNMVPSIQKVRFLKTGSEACSAAVRWARALEYFNGQKWRLLSDGYHGHSEEFVSLTPPAAGIPEHENIRELAEDYTEQDLKEAEAVIIEPLKLEATEERKAWLKKLRDDCTRNHAVLIFDEVITGMRVPEGSVSRWWEIEPDITCLGKAIANGFPLSIVGGREDILDNPDVFVSSTYSGDCVSLAACKATIEQIQTKGLKDLYYYANRFQDNLNAMTKDIGVELKGYGTRGMFDVTNPNTALFLQEAARAGIFMGKAFFYNFAHMEAGVDEWVLNVVSDVVNKIKSGRAKIEGDMPQETFRR